MTEFRGAWSAEVRPDVEAFMDGLMADDPSRAAASFRDGFLSMDPRSVSVVSRDELLMALRHRVRMFGSSGVVTLDRTALRELPLDEAHTLVEGTWQVRLAGVDADATPPTLRSTYLLRAEPDGWSAVAYLSHQDVATIAQGLSAPGSRSERGTSSRSPTDPEAQQP